MKAVLFVLSVLASFSVWAAPHDENADGQPQEFQTCMFESADVGKIKFRGTTREEAFEQTSRACLQSRVETFIRKKGTTPTVERKILFAEDCVNKTYCKH
ncbi:MAG: hypothetical protein IT287_02965 [Bdellovibrionaceae bacterium]|nr:hypothetical protein [Pseudobdellovibrionaceae bacterium]